MLYCAGIPFGQTLEYKASRQTHAFAHTPVFLPLRPCSKPLQVPNGVCGTLSGKTKVGPCWDLLGTLSGPCRDLVGTLLGPCSNLVGPCWALSGPCRDLATVFLVNRRESRDLVGTLSEPCRDLFRSLGPCPRFPLKIVGKAGTLSGLAGTLLGPCRDLNAVFPCTIVGKAGTLSDLVETLLGPFTEWIHQWRLNPTVSVLMLAKAEWKTAMEGLGLPTRPASW